MNVFVKIITSLFIYLSTLITWQGPVRTVPYTMDEGVMGGKVAYTSTVGQLQIFFRKLLWFFKNTAFQPFLFVWRRLVACIHQTAYIKNGYFFYFFINRIYPPCFFYIH